MGRLGEGEGQGIRRRRRAEAKGEDEGKGMRRKDKYGRGSAAANGEGFVGLAPGDGLRLYAIEALDIMRGVSMGVAPWM